MSEGAEPPAGTAGFTRIQAGRRTAAGRGRSPLFELFVLGELMNGPLHGYLLREILNRVLGPFRQLSWGALYPLIHDLEREGLIASDTEPGAEPNQHGISNRQRHSYRLTEAGRERFHRLMREPSAYSADYPELFMIKLNLFGYIALAQQLAILQHHRAYLQIASDYLLREQDYVANHVTLPEHERPHILRLLGYRLTVVDAELAWLDRELSRLAGAAPRAESC